MTNLDNGSFEGFLDRDKRVDGEIWRKLTKSKVIINSMPIKNLRKPCGDF
jgi:hypothetical protein